MLLKNATLLANNKEETSDVLIKDGKIAEIGQNLNADTEVIDCTGLLLTPGLVDVHVHLREPGFEHKKTITKITKTKTIKTIIIGRKKTTK